MAPGSRLQELTAKYMQNPRRFFVPLANEYRASNDLDRAIALCREHLPSQPGHMSGHIVLGRSYFEKGDIDAAREVFLTSVELDDENLIALRHLGDIARVQHQMIEARQWYARVLDADPQNDEIERLLQSLSAEERAALAGAEASDSELSAVQTAPAPGGSGAGGVLTPELADPTPPGLRAITAPVPGAASTSHRGDLIGHDLPAVPRAPLDRFDLTSFAADASEAAAGSRADEIQVDDGVGFIFDDLDALVDTASASATGTLPPVAESDFSAGIATPTQPAAVPAEPVADELLSRPGFGALASFASWRTAQERETPTHAATHPTPSTPATPATPVAPVTPVTPVTQAWPSVPEDGPGFFSESSAGETTSTAPEFITETMAALYAQQGFAQQALEVYLVLLAKTPGDPSLRARVAEMEALLATDSGRASLQSDADSALDFDDGRSGGAHGADAESMRESMYRDPSASSDDEQMASAFRSAWQAPSASESDWFSDAPEAGIAVDGGSAPDGMFGVAHDAFGYPVRPPAGGDASRSGVGVATPLSLLFGSPGAVAADATAADVLIALATEMVGRLPKEAPTLPVPDVLELPSAVAGDERAGTSPAPLLSFDRFFSGSGKPPRARIDTPVGSSGVTPAAPVSSPSLSPTFGGLPVIPPASVTPATWAAFDQFLPPAGARAPAESSVGLPVAAPDRATPIPAAAVPSQPTPRAPFAAVGAETTSTRSLSPPVAETPLPPPTAAPPSVDAPPADATLAGEEPRAAPSDFHRWLEGLS